MSDLTYFSFRLSEPSQGVMDAGWWGGGGVGGGVKGAMGTIGECVAATEPTGSHVNPEEPLAGDLLYS